MDKKYTSLAEYTSLFSLTVLTAIAVYSKNISIFYILYLFWWDELLKSFFDLLRYFFKKDKIASTKAYLSVIRGRLFFLMIYIVFIIIIFGLIMDWDNGDLIISNLEVLFFKNTLFNFTLFSIIIREIYLYMNKNEVINVHHLLSKGIITLHLSLILGVFIWYLFTKQFEIPETYVTVIAILPFLLLKIFFEIKEIQYNKKIRQTLIN